MQSMIEAHGVGRRASVFGLGIRRFVAQGLVWLLARAPRF
jgi:hypothetical protein